MKGEKTPDDKFHNPPLSPRKSRAAPSSGNRTLIAAGLVIILIVAAGVGVYLLAPSFTGKTSTTVTPALTPEVTAALTEVPAVTGEPTAEITPEQAPTPEVTAVVAAAPAPLIPQNGVWVRIDTPVISLPRSGRQAG